MNARPSVALVLGSGLVFLVPWVVGPPTAAAGGGASYVLRAGYSAQALADVGTTEAVSVTRTLTEAIARRTLRISETQTRAFRELPEMVGAFLDEQLDLVAVTGDEFVRLSAQVDIEPVFVPARKSGDTFSLLVVARRDTSSFAALRGARILTSRDQSRQVQALWIETEAMRAGFSSAQAFFGTLKEARNPAQAVLSVFFFGQVDACLISGPAFDLASEMNPQLKSRLTIVARTPPLASGVIAFRRGYPQEIKDRVVRVMSELHQDPEGQQLLRLFGTEYLEPFRPDVMTGTRALVLEYQKQLALSETRDRTPQASKGRSK